MTDQSVRTSAVPAVEIAVRTDPGRDPEKQVNEDASAYVETPFGLLAIVCDGMGGHAGGKEASELAVQTIISEMQNADPQAPPGEALRRALVEANARVWNMPTAEAGLRPGSTAVVVLIHEGGAEIAHVGDSRVYLVHAGAISQVTRDHSMVQELVDRNIIKAEDAQKHPDANKILRALGIAKDVEVEVRPEPIAYVPGDVFVLCSDGLSDLVAAGEILQVAGSHQPAQAAGRLVDLANARGGHDNITALVLRTKTTAAPSAPPPTIQKTIPLTAAGAVAHGVEAPAPGGTLVAGPMPPLAPAPTLPSAQVPGSGPTLLSPVHGPAGPPPGHPAGHAGPPLAAIPAAPATSRRPEHNKLPIVIALVVAMIALAILVVLLANRGSGRNPVKVIAPEAPVDAAVVGSSEPVEDASVEAVHTAAPPLATPSERPRLWRRRDGSTRQDAGAAPLPAPSHP